MVEHQWEEWLMDGRTEGSPSAEPRRPTSGGLYCTLRKKVNLLTEPAGWGEQ